MNITFLHRAFIIVAIICLAACSTLSVEDRVNRIVERVREAASIGFVDATIDYVEPNLYISGHTYATPHVSRLMRSIVIDRTSNLKLIEVSPQNVDGLSTLAFQLVEYDVGHIRKWSGPITLKFPRPENSAEMSADMLRVYSLNDFVYIAVIGTGAQNRAVIRTPDGRLYRVKVGDSIGKERAMINEINEKSVFLLEQTGTKRELKIFQQH